MNTGFQFVRTLLFLLFLAGPINASAQSQFLDAIDDLPLMSGLQEVEGGAMVFDSPAGRIVESLSVGAVKKAAVLRYYSQTLPQLGWQETAPGQFSREGEMLRLEFPPVLASSSQISVRFMLSPNP